MLIANHTGKEHEEIGWAVGDAIYEYLVKQGKTVEDIEKNPSKFAKLVVKKLQEREIIGPTVARSTQKAIKEVIPYTVKLINKMWPKDHNIKHLRAMREAFSPDTRDPVRTLKAAGVDITNELEELRNIIAEISGKKPKAAKKTKGKAPRRRNSKSGKRVEENQGETSITLEVQKLLGILQGLKFAGYSQEAVEKAVEELDARIDELIDKENLELLGLYLSSQRLLKRGEFKRAERFLKTLLGP